MKPFQFFILVLLLVIGPHKALAADIKKDIEKTAFSYFIQEAHPVSGLVRDNATNFKTTPDSNRVSSMAATGFGLAVIAHAGTHGLYQKNLAIEYIRKTLLFSRDHVPRYKGWFLHFVDWESGQRIWQSEYSTIDTALFMAGALYASQVLKDPMIHELTQELYRDMDFHDMMTDNGQRPDKRTLTLSYTPEHGYVPYQWEIYSEQLILLVLGLGHPTRPLPVEAWTAWKRLAMGLEMPLFIHQYSLLFLDFRKFDDGFDNYFQAGLKATLLHRNILKQKGFWGLSAGDSPEGYKVYSPLMMEGTFCVGCAAGSLMFAPVEIYKDIEAWKNGSYGTKLWGRYGLVDSLNIDRKWFSPLVLGITKGPEYLSSVNSENKTSLWYDFMAIPAIRKATQTILSR